MTASGQRRLPSTVFYLLCEKSDVSRLITPPSQMQLTRMVFKREKEEASSEKWEEESR